MSDWKYIYIEDGKENFTDAPPMKPYPSFQTELEADPNTGLVKKRGAPWEKNFTLPFAPPYKSFKDPSEGPCDEAHPQIFHMFLLDWEELWVWKGAFAHRWSRLGKYNTAVSHLNKGSVLGSFLFRTASKSGLDFHPMTVSTNTKDAHLGGILMCSLTRLG